MTVKKSLDDMFNDLQLSSPTKTVTDKPIEEPEKEKNKEIGLQKKEMKSEELSSKNSGRALTRSQGRPKGSTNKSAKASSPSASSSIDSLFNERVSKNQTSITLDRDILTYVDDLAKAKHISRSEIINVMLRYVIEYLD